MTVLYAITALGLALCAVALATVRQSGAARALAIALAVNAFLVGRNVVFGLPGFGWLSHPAVIQISVASFVVAPAALRLAVERAGTGGPWQRDDRRVFVPALAVALILLGVQAIAAETLRWAWPAASFVLVNAAAVPELARALRGTRAAVGDARRALDGLVATFCVHWALSMGAWAASLAGLYAVGPASWLPRALEFGSVSMLLVFGLSAAAVGVRRAGAHLAAKAPPTVLERASAPGPNDSAVSEVLARILDDEQAALDPDLTLDSLSSQVGKRVDAPVTARDVSRVLVAHFDGFRSAVAQRRVAAAKRILDAEPDAPVLDVLHRSGFSSTSAFHRAFKAHTGTTPGGYRERRLGGQEVPLPEAARQDEPES